MEILCVAIGILAFFAGVCVGALLILVGEGSPPHLMEMDDPYQPFE